MINRLTESLLWLLLIPLIFLPDVLFAQQVVTATSSTVAPTLTELVGQGQHAYELFSTGAILAGLAAVINTLVNVSKIGAINEYIKRKKLKWIRLVAALVLGFLGGLATALTQGMEWPMATVTSLGGVMSGGGAVVIHELISMLKGNRS